MPPRPTFLQRFHQASIKVFHFLTPVALIHIWPALLFFGGWAAGIVAINKYTSLQLSVSWHLLTVVGIMIGLTLTHRTSVAQKQRTDGENAWSKIHESSRTWSRLVWIHCPNSKHPSPPDDVHLRTMDQEQTIVEKTTMVKMAHVFAVAVRHHLRDEQGSMSLDSPQISTSFRTTFNHPRSTSSFKWSRLIPFRRIVNERIRANTLHPKPTTAAGTSNVPDQVLNAMSTWIATLQNRKTVDPSIVASLSNTLGQFDTSFATLQRVSKKPVPSKDDAHLWEVACIWVLMLPFELYEAGFGWVTVPALVIVTYIVIGFASMGGKIGTPFGYDSDDMNIDLHVDQSIPNEINALMTLPTMSSQQFVEAFTLVPNNPHIPATSNLPAAGNFEADDIEHAHDAKGDDVTCV